MGLKYYGEFDLRIPRAEMDKHNENIQSLVAKIDPNYIVEITGSYRRQEKDSGDIDVLITHPDKNVNHEENFKRIIALFQKENYITDIFAQGNKKCLAVCKAKRFKHFRRIDLMMTDLHEFPFALLYFTGSANFNVEMRNLAIEKGYSLSEYGLKCLSGDRKGDYVNTIFTTEQDVFEFLGLKYVPPQDRKSNVLYAYKK
jgi:DNA polymerase/3'-5' exonuclease PolX